MPRGVVVKDASTILSRKEVFKAHGSYAIFADYFRAMLLWKKGGIWVDTDIVCLHPFDFSDDLVLGFQEPGVIGNAVMKLPAGHTIAKKLLDRCERPWDAVSKEVLNDFERSSGVSVNDLLKGGNAKAKKFFNQNSPWGALAGPYGLTQIVNDLKLMKIARHEKYFYPVPYQEWWSIFYDPSLQKNLVPGSYAIHFWRECFKQYRHFDKNLFGEGTVADKLMKKYDLD